MKKSATHRGKVGSPVYMAPEMLLDKEYDSKADIYSFGILLNVRTIYASIMDIK